MFLYLATVFQSLVVQVPDCRREREFPGSDDLRPMLKRVGATLVKSEEHLPTSVNGKQTLSRQELDQQRESRNRAQNRYWTWK
jgi:hypothetical protein